MTLDGQLFGLAFDQMEDLVKKMDGFIFRKKKRKKKEKKTL